MWPLRYNDLQPLRQRSLLMYVSRHPMTEQAATMVRFFCLVTDGTEGDLSYSYLRAIEASGRTVRAIPIGAHGISDEARWDELGALFLTPVVAPYVNVVCAHAGMLLGTRTPIELGREEDLPPELRSMLGVPVRLARATPALVYQPQTAFSGLLTLGCPNVAILQSRPNPDEAEALVLARYDVVICPTPADAQVLGLLGVKAIYLPPTADMLRRVIEELCCASGITAILANSLAMDALREITSSPFTVPAAWSLKSSTSEADTARLRIATSSSTSLSTTAAPSGGWLRRMWRSITRRPTT